MNVFERLVGSSKEEVETFTFEVGVVAAEVGERVLGWGEMAGMVGELFDESTKLIIARDVEALPGLIYELELVSFVCEIPEFVAIGVEPVVGVCVAAPEVEMGGGDSEVEFGVRVTCCGWGLVEVVFEFFVMVGEGFY